MKKKSNNSETLFFLGKTNNEELDNNFDRIYDIYKYLTKERDMEVILNLWNH